MSTLVLIGLALVAAGFVLLALRFVPRVRRQFAATAPPPRTVADLVRLREQTPAQGMRAAPPTPTPTPTPTPSQTPAPPRPAAAPAAAVPAAHPKQAPPQRPAPRVAPVAAAAPAPPAPEPPAPAFVPPPPRPTPVAGRVRRESAEPPSVPLDGDNSPWQRGARMAVGLGGGQPWREPPAPPAPLRIVPTAEPPASGSPAEPEAPAPMRIVPAEPEARTDSPEEPGDAPAPDTAAAEAPVRPVPTEAALADQPGPPEPAVPAQAVCIEPGAAAATRPPAEEAPVEPGSGEQAESSEAAVPARAGWTEPAVAAAAGPAADEAPVETGAGEQSEPPEVAVPAQAVWVEPGAVTAADSSPEETPVEPGSGEQAEPSGAAVPAQAVWTEPAVAAATGPAAGEATVDPGPARPAATEPTEPVAPRPAVWIEPASSSAGTAATSTPEREPAVSAPAEGEIPIPDGWDDVEAEGVPTGAVPDRFAEEGSDGPDAQAGRRRSRRTPDERAAEQAAADLALLRTFGFADPGLRPDSAPVVEMERPDEQEPPAETGDAQPVRYRVIRRDGSVVGGATVTLLDDRGGDVAAGAADPEGRGELLAPSPGGYVLISTAAGHQPGAVAITVNGSATEADILIARSASVSGSVHGEDGPIVGARVTLVQDGEAVDAVDTAADGTYRIGDIGAGEYGLSVAAAGCEPVAMLLEVADEADVRRDVVLVPASPVADSELVEDDALSGLR